MSKTLSNPDDGNLFVLYKNHQTNCVGTDRWPGASNYVVLMKHILKKEQESDLSVL